MRRLSKTSACSAVVSCFSASIAYSGVKSLRHRVLAKANRRHGLAGANERIFRNRGVGVGTGIQPAQ
jgi:hypothetical protein